MNKKERQEIINEEKAKEIRKKQIEDIQAPFRRHLGTMPDKVLDKVTLMLTENQRRMPRNVELQRNPNRQARELAREQRAIELSRQARPKKKKVTVEDIERKIAYALAK